MYHSLNPLKGVVTKGDTRSLDNGSYSIQGVGPLRVCETVTKQGPLQTLGARRAFGVLTRDYRAIV